MNTQLLFANKANRDARYREMKAKGIVARRGSIRNQQLHPMYVEDEKQGLSKEDCGFGNAIYKTLYGTLYTLEPLTDPIGGGLRLNWKE